MDFIFDLARGLLGLATILGIAWLCSNNRTKTNWKMVGIGLLMQLVLAVFLLQGHALGDWFAPLGWPKVVFGWISSIFVLVLNFTTDGAIFVFGNIAIPPEGGIEPGSPLVSGQSLGQSLAFQVLPTVIFFGSLMAVLYHLGIMQRVVQGMAFIVRRLLGTSGAESLSVAANVFVGQTEAPLVIRPYLQRMTTSELMAIMTGGMATIAGGVLAAYVIFLGAPFAAVEGIAIDVAQLRFAEHLLGASVMAAPAALIIAKILVPETGKPETDGSVELSVGTPSKNVIDAAATGAGDGLKLALNIAAMLIAFLALIALIDYVLNSGAGLFGGELSLGRLFGWTFAPLAWLIGVPWQDAMEFGSLLGIKVAANEFVAYLDLAQAIQAGSLEPKTVIMATFALCGFANFASIAIQIGGIGPLAPSRRSEIAQLGLKAVLAGTLANLMTATMAGVMAT